MTTPPAPPIWPGQPVAYREASGTWICTTVAMATIRPEDSVWIVFTSACYSGRLMTHSPGDLYIPGPDGLVPLVPKEGTE